MIESRIKFWRQIVDGIIDDVIEVEAWRKNVDGFVTLFIGDENDWTRLIQNTRRRKGRRSRVINNNNLHNGIYMQTEMP